MTPELQQQLDLIAQAKQLAQHIDDDFTGHLSKIVTLKYGRLLLSSDEELFSKENQQRAKTLSLMSQDFARLRRCEIANRRALLEEARFESNEEKTEQEVFGIFAKWTQHPDIRRLLILPQAEHMRQMRKMYDIPPTKEDLIIEQELAALQKKQAASKQSDEPEPPEDNNEGGPSSPPPAPTEPSPASEKASQSNEHGSADTLAPSERDRVRGQGLPNETSTNVGEFSSSSSSPSPSSRPSRDIEPTQKKSFLSKLRDSLLGKTKEQTIAEIEGQHILKTKPAPTQNSKLKTQNLPSPASPPLQRSNPSTNHIPVVPPPTTLWPHAPSQSLWGPAPPPIRPGDRWKVQCS